MQVDIRPWTLPYYGTVPYGHRMSGMWVLWYRLGVERLDWGVLDLSHPCS